MGRIMQFIDDAVNTPNSGQKFIDDTAKGITLLKDRMAVRSLVPYWDTFETMEEGNHVCERVSEVTRAINTYNKKTTSFKIKTEKLGNLMTYLGEILDQMYFYSRPTVSYSEQTQ